MFEFSHIYGSDVKATDGTRAPIRDVLPVPLGSEDVSVPRELKAGRPIRDAESREALRPFATALAGFLGGGKMTLQGAGIKLRQIPNFAEIMVAQKITGIGSLLRFVRLFPEFAIEGKAPRGTVRMEHAQNFRSTSQDRSERHAILGNGKSAKMGWAIEDYHESGAVGQADAATADKGRAVVEAAGEALAALLAELVALPLETVRR